MRNYKIVIVCMLLITSLMCVFSIETLVADEPPYVPSNPNPQNNSTGLSININLSWTGGDPDNDNVTYDVYFWLLNTPVLVSKNQSNTYYHLDTLNYSTTYFWKIIAWDNTSQSNSSPIWSFTTQQEPEYTLIINIDGSGLVQKEPEKESYKYDDIVTLTAIADLGWAFLAWTGDLNGSANPDTITITGDMTVTALFIQEEYTLTMDIVGSGFVVRNPNQTAYHYGDNVTLTANPAAGWVFNHWGGDLSGSVNPTTITMTGDKSIIANFSVISGYLLNILVQGSGTVVKVPEKPEYSYGEVVNLTADPSAGWLFHNWSGNLTGNTNPVTITMDGNKSVIANFTVTSGYTLTITVQGSGMVVKTPNLPSYTYGQVVSLSPIPAAGWAFYHWSGNISGSKNPATIPLNGNKSVTAHFIIATQPGPGGGDPPVVPQNNKPMADVSAGEPYKGYVNTQILFDGSRSTDSDGSIVDWYWVFGDDSDGIGRIINHTYSKQGTYTVTLTVTDNAGAINAVTTTCVVKQPNRPPTTPSVTGPTTGTKNTLYTYTAVSTDADNDSLQYTFDWDDSVAQSSEFLPNATKYSVNQSWSNAGRFNAVVTVSDNLTVSSSKITVYIDAVQARGAGYLLDTNSDGIYDAFFSDEMNLTSAIQVKGDSYLIDKNRDGIIDYVYNETSGLTSYQEPRKTPGFELVCSLGALMILAIFWKMKRKKR
ncbi:MAG: PKD domain-containing protein [Candidatus Thermoplasmatota archaeon]|nr:PKD domain-containing protein [Candidatus Thermoplasmatota archaeon]